MASYTRILASDQAKIYSKSMASGDTVRIPAGWFITGLVLSWDGSAGTAGASFTTDYNSSTIALFNSVTLPALKVPVRVSEKDFIAGNNIFSYTLPVIYTASFMGDSPSNPISATIYIQKI